MEPFQEKLKWINWGIVILAMLLPMVIKVHISIQLIMNSVACVILGSLYSIVLKKEGKRTKGQEDAEVMQMGDVLKFPIQASMALLILYVLFDNIDQKILLTIFKLNFGVLGTTCIGTFIHERMHFLAPNVKDQVLIDKTLKFWGEELKLHLTTTSLLAYLPAALISLAYILTDFWALSNVLGISFTIAAIMLLKVGSFKIIFVMLWLLFFYDIFWVFGSDVMVTVATKFDVPIKLKFPNGEGKFSILGLGDMVIPGILVALALKFDVDSVLSKQVPKETSTSIEKVVREPVTLPPLHLSAFFGAAVGYISGILLTLAGMFWMEKAQPALLYLVPTCTIGVLVPIIISGRLKEFYYYDSEKEEKEKEK